MVPAAGGVADAVVAGGVAVEAALAQELLGGAGLAGVEVALEVLGGDLVRVQQPLAPAAIVWISRSWPGTSM